ncbi:preprotein translocase subunit SecG [Tautonia plasticadhaerens]|nr:preprotein translocase subunit SecG [Tautonia plasticadhaerens]
MPYVISSLIALVVCTILGYVLPPAITYILVGLVSAFMICLVLIQRGRGGGLAGAFGGVGGSSAFGTRAGDVFTRITIVTASVWIALNMGLVVNANTRARDAQQGPVGGEFLPEGIGGAGDATAPDSDSGLGAGRLGVPPDLGGEDAGSDLDSPEAPADLPPALDGGQPPNADDADLNVEVPAPEPAPE